MKNQAIIFGSVAVVVVGVLLFLKTTTGKAVGKQVGDAVTGFGGAVLAPVTQATDSLGSWIGISIYDLLHPAAK